MGKLASTFTNYNWFIKALGAALLIAFAIILWVMDVEPVLEAFIGILIAGYAIVRLVPFIKTQRSDLLKTINIIEITLNLLVAAFFISSLFLTDGEGWGALFGYMLGGVLVARGMVHFYGLSDGNEKGDHVTYFFHIATLIVGTLIISRGFNIEDLIILMIIMSLGASGYLGFESYRGYSMYRRRKQLEQSKEQSDRISDKDIQVPRKEDPDRERDHIVS